MIKNVTVDEIKSWPVKNYGQYVSKWRVSPNDDHIIIGKNVAMGNYIRIREDVMIGDNVTIGDDVKIGSCSMIRNDVTIGDHVEINDHVIICSGVTIGDYVKIGNRVRISNHVRINSGQSPPALYLTRYPIYWSAPGVIGSGCIQRPYKWWSADDWHHLRLTAAENNYSGVDIAMYIDGFQSVWRMSESMGLNTGKDSG